MLMTEDIHLLAVHEDRLRDLEVHEAQGDIQYQDLGAHNEGQAVLVDTLFLEVQEGHVQDQRVQEGHVQDQKVQEGHEQDQRVQED
jgi:hypothetical protein